MVCLMKCFSGFIPTNTRKITKRGFTRGSTRSARIGMTPYDKRGVTNIAWCETTLVLHKPSFCGHQTQFIIQFT